MVIAMSGLSMPNFWLGIVLILIFGVWLRWLPVQGRIDPFIELETITGFYIIDSILTQNWDEAERHAAERRK